MNVLKTKNSTNRISFIYIGICIGLLMILSLWHAGDIRASVAESGDSFLYLDYAVLVIGLFAVCILGIFLIRSSKLGIELIAAALILLLGIANIYVFKGLSAPDEVSHYISAYKLSNRMLGQPVCDEYGRVYVRASDIFLEDTAGDYDRAKSNDKTGESIELKVFGQLLDESVYHIYHDTESLPSEDKTKIEVSNQWTVNTIPTAYLPQAVGISLARILGLGPLWLISLGKLFNLIFFAAVSYSAMRLMPKAKEITAGVCLTPMVLHLAGSMSYDAYVLGMCFLFTALVLNMKEYGTDRRKACALVCTAALLAPCKLIYTLILFFLFILMPGRNEAASKRKAFAIILLLYVLFAAAAMFIVNHATIGNYAAADESVIEWADQAQGYTIGYLLHRPFELIDICYRSVLMMTGTWFSTMFGIYMGNLDPVLNVPYPLIACFAVGLLIIAAGSKADLSCRDKCISAICFVGVFLALMGTMLIAYTPMSSIYIEGVQGRYLLPVLPLLLLCIPGDWISVREGAGKLTLITFVISESYVLIRIFATITLRIG